MNDRGLSRSPPRRALLALLLLAATLRLIRYIQNPPLWIDEAQLALNIGARDFAGLAHPLDYGQVAPLLYLWLVKGCTTLFGMSEWVLRFPSLVGGLMVPPLTWLIGRRLLGTTAALIAVALVAVDPLLIGYSSEAKPYSTGAAAFLAMLWLATREMQSPSPRGRMVLGLAGLLVTGLTFKAPFVLTGIGITLFLLAVRARDVRRTLEMVGWSFAWGLSFVVQYISMHAAVGSGEMMRLYWWHDVIRVAQPGRLWRTVHAIRETLRVITVPDNTVIFGLLLLVLVVAIVRLARQRRSTTMLLLLPIAVMFVFSAAGLFPIRSRLILPEAPILALLFGALLADGWHAAAGRRITRIAYPVVCMGLLAANLWWFPPIHPTEGTRQLVRTLAGMRHGEPIYLLPRGVPTWVFYTTDWSRPEVPRLTWFAAVASPGGESFHNAPPRGRPAGRPAHPLEWAEPSGLAIIGQSSGVSTLVPAMDTLTGVDPGWADVEMGRLADASPDGTGWLFGAHLEGQELQALRDAIARAGGSIIAEYPADDSLLLKVRLASRRPSA